jgi:two-component system CheB/CheR fusion protein
MLSLNINMKENPKSAESGIEKSQNPDEDFPIVGMGASAGGLEALEKFFENMPHDSGIAFVIVMHFDPASKSLMSEILKRYSKMEVVQVEEGMKVEPDHVYIIPPNKDMAILRGFLHLLEPVVSKGIRHPIDFFFRSLADDKREKSICIILSGTGTEGTLGLKAVKGEDGMVIVQDVKSAAYDGMPASAIATGLADYILPPEKMPEQLIKYVKQSLIKSARKPERISEYTNSIQKIIILIRDKTGHDFSLYKQNTIIRKVERRMNIHQIDKISDYTRYLQENPSEIETLYKGLLIGVTKFFRDPQAYEILKKEIMPELLKNKTTARVWVPACSTGEEAYSMAIVFKEFIDETKSKLKVQIFSTDVDKAAIEIARAGVYPDSIAVDVSQERLQRFFRKNPDTYMINKEIREMVIFSPQNVIKDPPFSKLDMVSCRNLLIYIGPELQKRLLRLFYFSLNPDGILFLGNSETIGEFTDLFTALDRKWKIYKRKGGEIVPLMADITNIAPFQITQLKETHDTKHKGIDIGELTEKILLKSYVPSCVIINEKGDILYIHGKTGKYLEPSPGKASLNIMEMARDGLKFELNAAIRRVITQKKDIVFKDLNVKTDGAIQTVNLVVKPIVRPETVQGMMMVIFEDVQTPKLSRYSKKKYTGKQMNEHVTDLEHELKSTKENLQATIEELQTSNEELKSTNEELQSANEELQSANEELEASREELQSINEELMTLNAEHNDKLEEFSRVINDMNNLLVSTEIATIFLDNDLRVKGFTPAVKRIINLIETDIGRPVSDIVTNLVYENFVKDVKEVLDTLIFKEMEIKDRNNLWYIMRILPYRTTENIIDGAVITFIDITARKRIEQAEWDARIYADSIIDTIRESIVILDNELRVISANMSFYKTFQVSKEETENKLIYNLGGHQWDIPTLRELLEEIIPRDSKFNDFEMEYDFPRIGYRKMMLNARRINQEGIGKEMILLAIEDIKDRARKG